MKNEIKKKMFSRKKYILGVFLISIFSISIFANGNLNQGYIFGKVVMKNSRVYEGPIRWGKEEALWGDMFNSSKEVNECIEYLSKNDLKKIRRNKRFGKRLEGFFKRFFSFGNRDRKTLDNHQFICRFGDIKKISLRGNSRVSLTLKDNTIQELKSGSNDINAKIHVIDKTEGLKNLKWNRIKYIEFLPTPDDLKENFGVPLYGTVITESGSFKGFIQWDHEECLSLDILNGYTKDDSKLNIEFADIASIKKYRDGSKVTLYSGQEHKMYDTNDVNDDNRGIVINDLVLGKVMVDWDEFVSVKFEKNPDTYIPAYNDYIKNKELFGTVKTKGLGDYKGKIIFDLDEKSDLEMLEGTSDDIKYYIPLRNIEKIIPRGYYSKLILKNGKKIELEDGRDVTKENDGILIWDENKEKPVYIPWRKVREINFQ